MGLYPTRVARAGQAQQRSPMGPEQYAAGVFTGIQLAIGGMVFAVCFVVIVGRWTIGDEAAVGFLLRATVLVALFVVALRHFPTIWFWAVVPLAVVPLVDVWWGGGLSTLWIRRRQQEQLGEAMAEAAGQPKNAVVRVRLARALLESGQIESGLIEIERASQLCDEGSRKVVEEMMAEAKQEFVVFCPHCQDPNRHAAKACHRCFRPFHDNLLLGLALWVARPVLRRGHP